MTNSTYKRGPQHVVFGKREVKVLVHEEQRWSDVDTVPVLEL